MGKIFISQYPKDFVVVLLETATPILKGSGLFS